MGLVLVVPAVLLLLALTLYPVVYGAWISAFNKHSFFPEQTFIGLGNYTYVLSDPEFWNSVRLGSIYALSAIVLQIVLGVAAALVVNEAFPGRNIVRSILIFPYVVPTVVAVILWKWLLNGQFGLINYLLEDRDNLEWLVAVGRNKSGEIFFYDTGGDIVEDLGTLEYLKERITRAHFGDEPE